MENTPTETHIRMRVPCVSKTEHFVSQLQPVWDSGLKWCVQRVRLGAEMRAEVCAFRGLKWVGYGDEMGPEIGAFGVLKWGWSWYI